MRMLRRLGLALVATAALVGGLVAPANGGNQKIYAVEDCGKPEVKPDRIVFACADFGLYANDFDWRHWGDRKARTEGVLHAKVCKPNCAEGYFRDYPVELVLHRIKTWSCNGFRARFYRKVKMNFPGPKPNFGNFKPPEEFFCV